MKNQNKNLILLLLILPQFLIADVTLNTLFSDHMVVQRETEIPIWGWADAGESITVEASWGEKANTTALVDGSWKAYLRTPEAGGPYEITVRGKNTIEISDVLSGEVWLCTGQSNMDFAMERFINDSREPQYQPLVEYMRAEVKSANDDWIRYIEVPQTTSLFEKKKNFTNQWINATSGKIEKISATGYFFAKELRAKLNVPIGLIECSWGGTRIQPWLSKETYLEDKNRKEYFEASRKAAQEKIEILDAEDYVDLAFIQKLVEWYKNGRKGSGPRPSVADPRRSTQEPATLYNGMLSAVIPFAIKGVIWYQGESNAAHLPGEYSEYLTTMITSWRKEWNQGDFSFYWVQLAACMRGTESNNLGWAMVNDQMRRSLNVPNTGMAVLYDIGEGKDIHPHNKMDVGKRLALWALNRDYNMVTPVSGPLYKSKTIKGNRIEIAFDEAGDGLMVGRKILTSDTYEVREPLKWFEIKGDDGEWKEAQAKIIGKNSLEVWSKEVSNPKQVRYAWSGYPIGANLYNKDGLPAAVFTTEDY